MRATRVTGAVREPWLVALALAAAATLAAAGAVSPVLTVGATLGALGIAVLCRLSLHLLPAACLALFALIPTQLLPVMQGTVSPALVAAMVLLVRFVWRDGKVRMDGVLALWGVAGTLLCVATLASPRPTLSAAWSINALVLVLVLSLVMRELPGAADAVARTWLWLGGSLGAYALLELVLQRNPLMNPFFRTDPSLDQGWSIYRATTTLGHPLVNGVFFAVASTLGLSMLAARLDWRRGVLTLLSMGGVVASGSRGALIALTVGIVVILVGAALTARTRRVVGALVLLCLTVGVPAVLWVGPRMSSGEAAGSTATRIETLRDGQLLWQQHWLLGSGPGIADTLKREMTIGDSRRGIESSWLQLAVSLGAVGIAVTLLLVVVALVVSRRSVLPAIGAALIVYVVSIASFNLIEGVRPALVMLGLLLGLALTRRDEALEGAGPATGRRASEQHRSFGHAS